MSKLICTLLAVFACAVSNAATITLRPSAATVGVGESFTVGVYADSVVDLYAFQFDIFFTVSTLSGLSSTEGTLLGSGGGFFAGAIDNTAGAFSFVADSLFGPVDGVTGAGLLAILEFRADSIGTGQISLGSLLLLNSQLLEIQADVGPFATVGVGGALPEPSALSLVILAVLCLTAGKNGGQRTTGAPWLRWRSSPRCG